MAQLEKIKPSNSSDYDVEALEKRCYEAMNDDLNSPILIAHLFDGVKYINSIADGKDTIDAASLELLRAVYQNFVYNILGLTTASGAQSGNMEVVSGLVEFMLNLRKEAKANKDFATSDRIRDELTRIGITVRDRKDGYDWEIA
jgi:cysteinyl-tRNA synthetase